MSPDLKFTIFICPVDINHFVRETHIVHTNIRIAVLFEKNICENKALNAIHKSFLKKKKKLLKILIIYIL